MESLSKTSKDKVEKAGIPTSTAGTAAAVDACEAKEPLRPGAGGHTSMPASSRLLLVGVNMGMDSRELSADLLGLFAKDVIVWVFDRYTVY